MYHSLLFRWSAQCQTGRTLISRKNTYTIWYLPSKMTGMLLFREVETFFFLYAAVWCMSCQTSAQQGANAVVSCSSRPQSRHVTTPMHVVRLCCSCFAKPRHVTQLTKVIFWYFVYYTSEQFLRMSLFIPYLFKYFLLHLNRKLIITLISKNLTRKPYDTRG